MSTRRRAVTLLLAAAALVAVVAPAVALAQEGSGDLDGEAFVVLTGRLEVKPGDDVDEAVIFNGDAEVAGNVTGDVVAFNGDVVISGRVGENAIALNGRVVLLDEARVGGDVISRDRPLIAPGATVGGGIQRPTFDVDIRWFTFAGRLAVWIATSVSSFLLGLLIVLLLPAATDAIARTATERPGASIGWGALAFLAIPIGAIIATATLVGLPLGLGVLLALGLIYWIGYTAAAYAFGRRLRKPPTHRVLAFLVGWGILRALALIPFAAGLLWLAATVYGLGAVVVAARIAGRTGGRVEAPVPGTVPPPPPPPPPVSAAP
jgi:hypothetical protein